MAEVRVGLGRSNAVVTFAVLLFVGAITGVAVVGGLRAQESSARILGLAIGAIFAIPLVMLLKALPKFLAPRYVVLDAQGLRIEHGRDHVLLPWPEVAAVGIGYEGAPRQAQGVPRSVEAIKEQAVGRLAEHASEALQVSGRRRIALEIFPMRPEAGDAVSKLRPYWKALPAPMPGLPGVRWSFPLPPVTGIGERIAEGVRATQPNRWLGWIVRPWSGGGA
ncbi:MAG TPA: hypothetical protein VF062_28010 [Candidatus Limnocylindrales bacterium]